MKILIACEESQAVTIRMREKEHEAYSCDILPCSGGHPEWHLQQDVRNLLKEKWGMIIAFPPCTDLAVSGARYFEAKKKDGRQQKSINFFMEIAQANCEKIAIENPISIMSSIWRKPDQIIQPYQYGHDASKKTCLWLKGLPRLTPTKHIAPRIENGKKLWANQTKSGQNKLPPSKNRATLRSKTYAGIAQAMADQWG